VQKNDEFNFIEKKRNKKAEVFVLEDLGGAETYSGK